MGYQIFLFAALTASLPLVSAQRTIGACKEQGCQDCPIYAPVELGYPSCVIYPSAGNLDGYEAESGHGYDVWWNSDDPGDNCEIVVRTPASTDLPQCGYYVNGWDSAGCHYTLVQETFILQFCCGSGHCDAAAPGTSVNEVQTMAAQGMTAAVSLIISNMTAEGESGKRNFDGIEVGWSKRNPSSMSQLARDAAADTASDVAAPVQKRDCGTFTEDENYTKGGRQVRVSPTQNCNSNAGCTIEISTSIETGYSVSVSVGFNIMEIITAEVGMEFHESETRSISNTYTQASGTRGYVSFIPTFECTKGTVSDCDDDDIADGDEVEACTPRLIGQGDATFQDGTYSFVYE